MKIGRRDFIGSGSAAVAGVIASRSALAAGAEASAKTAQEAAVQPAVLPPGVRSSHEIGLRVELDAGVPIEGEARPAKPVRWRSGPGTLGLELAEGRSRIVRRICAALGLGVRQLVRLSYGPVSLGTLAPGRTRSLAGGELAALYRAAGLEPPDDRG